MIISTRSWLPDLVEGVQTSLPATALGYEAQSLWSGGIAQAWRSATASSIHQFRFRLGTSRPVGLVGLFDVRASGGASVNSISVRTDTVWPMGIGAAIGSITLGARRDGACYLPVPIFAESWSVWVTLSSAALLTVGEIWMGEATQLDRGYATRRDQHGYHQIQNVSDAQTVRTTELADYTRRYSLGWDRLREAERDQILAAWHGARGGARDVVVLPADDAADPVFGRLQPAMGWTVDFPVTEGMALDLVEGGRAIGA